MPIITFENKKDIPEDRLSEAKELENGKWELDASGLLKKYVESLSDNATLKTANKTLTADNSNLKQQITRLESGALPEGKVAVEPEIEKLGLAARDAGLKLTEIKTVKSELSAARSKLSENERAARTEKAAKAAGYNEKFTALAKEKGLDFEIETTGEGKDKQTNVFVLGEGGAKTKVDEFIKNDSFFSNFADTFAEQSEGFNWGHQESGKGETTQTSIASGIAKKRYAAPTFGK